MHRYFVLGINHKFAPLEVRERVAFPDRQAPAALKRVCEALGCDEAVLLSTCNRVELYAYAEGENVRDVALAALSADHGMTPEYLGRFTYFHRGRSAVEHLLRVSGGLDSLVLGETQILNQVKRAFLLAQSENYTGKALNGLFHRAFRVAKRLHTETGIGTGQVSISSVGVRFVKRVFEQLGDKTVLLVGAGEVGELTLTYLREQGVGRVIVVSRGMDRAREVAARFDGDAVPFDLLDDYLPAADIVVTQTSAEGRIITRRQFEQSQKRRGHASVFVLDLAVPRDVEESAQELEGVYLYNVDDLARVVAEHAEARSRELEQCQAIVRDEAAEFLTGLQVGAAGSLIGALREKADAIKEEELGRLLARLSELPVAQKDEITAFSERLVNKLLHPQIRGIKDEAARGDGESVRRMAEALGLDEEPTKTEPAPGVVEQDKS